jgi:hypothetical protein
MELLFRPRVRIYESTTTSRGSIPVCVRTRAAATYGQRMQIVVVHEKLPGYSNGGVG